MPTATQRVTKLETVYGATAFERWLKTATDEELQAEISRLHQRARDVLDFHGIEHEGIDGRALWDLAEKHGLIVEDVQPVR